MPGPEYAEWLQACNHYRAACKLAEGENPLLHRFTTWQCHILCTSIEVGLKAFLLMKRIGVDELDTRKKLKDDFGHNLVKLLGRATAEGLTEIVPLNPRAYAIIGDANTHFTQRYWIYAETRGYNRFPAPHELGSLAHNLLTGMEDHVDPRPSEVRGHIRLPELMVPGLMTGEV